MTLTVCGDADVQGHLVCKPGLLALESLAAELQGSAIFSNSANNLIGRSGWDFCVDLKRHLHG
jgi:hypothetical protein